MRNGGNSQDRRRHRRAAERRLARSARTASTSLLDLDAVARYGFDDLVAEASEPSLSAAASGSTFLPLSDQDAAWDASAADKRVREYAGVDDAPNEEYASAFFLKDGDGTTFVDYKLGFVDVVDGKLTAIWRGVTAAAGVLEGAHGGIDGISDADRASVKSQIEGYYAAAKTEYDDAAIKVPWEADASKKESAITLLALAEIADKDGLDIDFTDGRVALIGGSGASMDDFLERHIYWEAEFGEKPSQDAAGEPEVFALERLMGFAPGDVLWGPEDGFVDLIADINKLLRSGAGSMPDSDCCSYYACVDVRIDLSAALIVDYDEECGYSAPISIGSDGEPILSDRSEWKPVDVGLIETAEEPDDEAGMSRGAGTFEASRIRFELRDIVLTADGALAPELPVEHQPGEKMPRRRATPPAPAKDEDMVAGSGDVSWTAIFVPEASLTDDGRAFAPGSLAWRELPLSLMAMTETSAQGGHDGAVLAGRIDNIWREGNLIMASGVFDSGEFGVEIARMVGDKTLRGLSVDTAIHEYEIGPKSDYFDANGDWIADAPTRDAADDPDLAEMLFGDDEGEDRIFVVTSAVIGMATVCPFPAFAGANISLVASGGGAIWRYNRQAQFEIIQREAPEAITASASLNLVPKEVIVEVEGTGERMTISLENGWESVGEQVDLALTASAAGHAPTTPPAEWFENPGLEELTPLTITDDGQIFGHAWPWETCHIAFPDDCVPAPHSATENAYFHLGEIELDDGSRLSVGKITLDAPHAGARLSRVEATAHYDNTGTVVAHVVCGEDEFGGWVAGAIVPDLPEAKLRLLRGAALSGDWRSVNGNLELVALLAVNVPGFPVPRPRALVASGDGGEEVLSLTAAGVFTEKTPCEVAAEIAELAAEVDLDVDFATLVEQAEA